MKDDSQAVAKVKEIFSSTKPRATNYKIATVDGQSVIDESLQKNDRNSYKNDNNVKTLQQDIVLPAENSTEDNLLDSFLSLDIDSYKLIKKINWLRTT